MHRFGIDIVRFPDESPAHLVAPTLTRRGIDVVIDVGSNDGGYAQLLRSTGYTGRIVSLEPGRAAFERLEAASLHDPLWSTRRVALGPHDGTTTLNLAANDGHSSSVLPMLDTHVRSAPSAAYVASETADMARLDTIVDELIGEATTPFLKLDVQGYEMQVLEGAARSLELVAGVQIEVSLVPLYDGEADYLAVVGHLAGQGLETVHIVPGFRDPNSQRLLQADFVLLRSDDAHA